MEVPVTKKKLKKIEEDKKIIHVFTSMSIERNTVETLLASLRELASTSMIWLSNESSFTNWLLREMANALATDFSKNSPQSIQLRLLTQKLTAENDNALMKKDNKVTKIFLQIGFSETRVENWRKRARPYFRKHVDQSIQKFGTFERFLECWIADKLSTDPSNTSEQNELLFRCLFHFEKPTS